MKPRLLDLFDQFPGVLLITDAHGVILYVNKAVEQKYGYGYAESVGKNPGALWGGQMPDIFYAELWKRLCIQKLPFIGEVANHRKGSENINDHVYIFPILDHARHVRYFVELSLPGIFSYAHSQEFIAQGLNLFQHPEQFDHFFLEWSADWLSEDHAAHASIKNTFHAIAHTPVLHELLTQELIEPMQERLHFRFEDKSIITAVQKNVQEFSAIYTKYYTIIFEYILQHVNYSESMAEDMAQEVFLKAFEHIQSFELRNASYKTYLLRIAHNILINYYRKTQPVPLDFAERIASPEQVSEEVEHRYDLEAAERVLTPFERTVIELKYVDDLSIRDIARRIDKSENAVKLILSRTRKKLKNQ